ncbi:MAG: mechanosensitive ion channel family protein [Acidobacteria bacterium]|nr:mechanosensitive ion channel family protein [Acidobacteriota bacterium]
MEEKNKEHIEGIERWAKQLTGFIRHAVEIVAGVAALLIILSGLGIRGVPQLRWEQVAAWLTGPGLRILFVLGGAFALVRILHLLIARFAVVTVPRKGPLAEITERRKRTDTLSGLLRMVSTSVVMSVAVLIAIRELGFDIMPILTGVGIGGLAIGFGAQNLVRDLITGFFIILENQVRVGDVAIINGTGGFVEEIRLRTIVLRGLDGTVHVIPNGAITELSNMTKDFSYYVIDLGVAYKENVDRVMDVLKEIGEELQSDPAFADKILGPLEILGVDDFADSAVIIKVRIKTTPIQQWTVGRELRRRIKNTFDAQGIEIPFPHLSLYMGEASKPFAVEVAEKLGYAQAASESKPKAR